MKYKVTECDICGKDISGQFQYRFKYWHWRTGTYSQKHMCQECFDKFKDYVKGSEVAE